MKGEEIRITDHAYMRLKERNGWGHKTSRRMAEKVFENGRHVEDMSGCLRTWYENRPDWYAESIYIKYGKDIYVYRGNSLITCFHEPRFGQAEKRRRNLEAAGREALRECA